MVELTSKRLNGTETASPKSLDQAAICQCFNALFGNRFGVELCGGGVEPDYLPGNAGLAARLIAREDFAASALHEAAHWCVAGKARRALPDYGYRYTPPPRGDAGQQAFFRSELRIQATEAYLARRAGVAFAASADDPDYSLQALRRFERQVLLEVARWEAEWPQVGVPPRARQFAAALARVSGWHAAPTALPTGLVEQGDVPAAVGNRRG